MTKIVLGPCKKGYKNETHRAVSPETTLARVEPLLSSAGITRVADITSLDRVGIPVFSCMRPTAAGGAISVYNGKGATPAEARVSAIMEGIERHSAELRPEKIEYGTYEEVRRVSAAVQPKDLCLPQYSNPDLPIPWTEGYDIISQDEVWVPAHAVFHPVWLGNPPLFRTNTNGIASGNTLEEAVFHALAEVIERDAWSIVEATRNTGKKIVDIPEGTCNDLLQKFNNAGIEIILKDITSDIGLPTVAAIADDITLKEASLLTIGMGTHTTAEIAVMRALTEVAQSRLTQIHGAREDTTSASLKKTIGYERAKRLNRYWFNDEETISFEKLQSFESDDFLSDIELIKGKLKDNGLSQVIISDLTIPELDVPVVRVVIPGMEVFAIDNERIGSRCNNARKRRVPRPKP